MSEKYDLTVVGGGPGGYVAAIKGAQLKKRVVLVEKDRIGGTCMNYGCIPTKYLLHQTKIYREMKENKNIEGPIEDIKYNWKAIQEKKNQIVERLVGGIEFLLKKNGVNIVAGTAFIKDERKRIVEIREEEKAFESDKIILATGSKPAELSFLVPNGNEIITSREALEFERIPERLLIVGAGAIGLEMGTIFQRLGSKVTILEIMPTILPGCEKDIVTRLERILRVKGIKIYTQMKIKESQVKENRVCFKCDCLKTQSSFEFEGDKVLLAAGRNPNSEFLKEKDSEITLDTRGFVKVNSHLETNIPGIYAIGDMIGGKLLAHKASHEGLIAAGNASGNNNKMDYNALPMAVFTEPEFSSVGFTEEEAREKGFKAQVGVFHLQANGRALSMGSPEGIVKIIADENDKIIGAHILSSSASELISEMSLAIKKRLTLHDVSSNIHVHPTLSEAVMEAAMKVKNEAIHVLNI